MDDDEDDESFRPDPRQEWRTLGLALDQFNGIETHMARIICLYMGPRAERESWVQRTLLNNSNVSFAAKLKLIQAISRDVGGPKINGDAFRKMLKIRNALAHGDILRSFRRAPVESGTPLPDPIIYLVVESVENNGEVKEIPRTLAISDFFALASEAMGQVVKLLHVMDPDFSQEPIE